MNLIVVGIVVLVFFIVGLIVFALSLSDKKGGKNTNKAVSSNLRNMVMSQREARSEAKFNGEKYKTSSANNLAIAAAAEGDIEKKGSNSSQIDLEKKLKYAKWPITKVQFRAIQAFLAIFLAVIAYSFATVFIVVLGIFYGIVTPVTLLDGAINRRFNAFDKDYPVLLMSFVSLLKTGMSPIQGLEAAGKGLDEDCLVREEVELLVERLRLGMTEEQAISAFGEDVAHPELELFVQSLILSKRVGGTLSLTLERLAKQVRKRQEFRKRAIAAIGLEKASLKMIALVMTLLLFYMTWKAPELVVPALKHPLGKQVFQYGILSICVGFYWSKVVANIKV